MLFVFVYKTWFKMLDFELQNTTNYTKRKLQGHNVAQTFMLDEKNNCVVLNCHSKSKSAALVKFGVAPLSREKALYFVTQGASSAQ